MPPGSELLLLICMICGIASWYANTFTDRGDIVKVFSIIGVASMASLMIWVAIG